MLTKLGAYMYLVLKRIWNPIDFQGQGHQVKSLGEGIRHTLPCPCLIVIDDVDGIFHSLKLNLTTLLNFEFPFLLQVSCPKFVMTQEWYTGS